MFYIFLVVNLEFPSQVRYFARHVKCHWQKLQLLSQECQLLEKKLRWDAHILMITRRPLSPGIFCTLG